MNLLSLTLLLFIPSTEVKDVVKEFHELKTKESELTFIENHGTNKEASILAYVIAVEMKQAEYSYNPISKLITFNRSKKKLELLIASNPANVHLRYIRLVLQEQTPGILNYNDYIEEDRMFLSGKLEVQDPSDYMDTYIYNHTSL